MHAHRQVQTYWTSSQVLHSVLVRSGEDLDTSGHAFRVPHLASDKLCNAVPEGRNDPDLGPCTISGKNPNDVYGP